MSETSSVPPFKSSKDATQQSDEALLASLGYKQEFKRAFTPLEVDANTAGSVAAVSSIDWGCAVQIMAAVNIGSNEKFEPTSAQTL
ncbi:hypothetical protein DXG03_005632 [Asterophora parasitica]|uniref:Uncharacterized protein n=1 Tax=Asterophora parasitica TaxID=117018 RepID=A0A9P7KBE1_9AGAR|nr:hypothetical protein DXG03_005632 [Asterophora parasitica]